MPNAKSALELKGYFVKKIFYEMNEKFDFSKETQVSVNPKFKREINKIDENLVSVDLSVEIKGEEKQELPFLIDIRIQGIFYFKNWEEGNNKAVIENNAVAVLFPYIRTLVTFVTSNANMTPYIIPVMNIVALFEQENKKRKNDD